MSTSISATRDGPRAVITLAAEAGKPAVLDHEVLDALDQSLSIIEAALSEESPEGPRVVIIQSDSPKYFCAGANLKVLQTQTEANFPDWLEAGHGAIARLEALPVPVVAKVGGYALGGGLELALAADVIIAGESARLGLTEARLGFVPGWGGLFRLSERVGRSGAKHLFFSSQMVDGTRAAALGLVDQVVPDQDLDEAVRTFTDEILTNSAASLAAFKRVLDEEREASRQRVDSAEKVASMDCIRDPDTVARIQHYLSRKTPK